MRSNQTVWHVLFAKVALLAAAGCPPLPQAGSEGAGAAAACADNGAQCSVDADCCSDYCPIGQVGDVAICSDRPDACVANGGQCSVDADCCSDYCPIGQVGDVAICSDRPDACVANGGQCSVDADCCSDYCPIGQVGDVANCTKAPVASGGGGQGGSSASSDGGGGSSGGACPFTVDSLACGTACTQLSYAAATGCDASGNVPDEVKAYLTLSQTADCVQTCESEAAPKVAQWKCFQGLPTFDPQCEVQGCTAARCPN